MSVRDDGHSFDPKYSDVIFAPFKRLHGRDVPGSGIEPDNLQTNR